MNYFFPALCLIFVTLKLTGFIAWSWWIVFAPVYVPVLIAAILFVVFSFIAAKS
jgi:hypothetical protein